MNNRLHEIMAKIAVLHEELINNNKIINAKLVFEAIEEYDSDIKDHYVNLLLQYYFQKNDLNNFKEVLLKGARFDIRFDDVKEAILCIKNSEENVIEFMEEAIVFIKDKEIDLALEKIHDYYNSNEDLQVNLEEAIEVIKKNRYICAYCAKNPNKKYAKFFLNEDLLESLKRDLPYLLK